MIVKCLDFIDIQVSGYHRWYSSVWISWM